VTVRCGLFSTPSLPRFRYPIPFQITPWIILLPEESQRRHQISAPGSTCGHKGFTSSPAARILASRNVTGRKSH